MQTILDAATEAWGVKVQRVGECGVSVLLIVSLFVLQK